MNPHEGPELAPAVRYNEPGRGRLDDQVSPVELSKIQMRSPG
jgi:hypothetical protein